MVETKNNNSENPKKRPPSTSLLRFADMAFRMAVTIGVGVWLGKWLDSKMGMTKPIFLPIVAMIAVCCAMYMVIRDANKIKNE
jgi:F0F1-type ATP synthase assembly protein I